MSTGKALSASDLFEKDAFKDALVNSELLLQIIKETKTEIKGSMEVQKQFVSTFKVKSYDDVKKLNQALAESSMLIKQKTLIEKSEIEVLKQNEKLLQEKQKTQREINKTTEISNKQNRAAEKSLNTLNGEYTKGAKHLNEIKKQLKELEFTGRSNGKLYKALGEEFQSLDKKVRGAEQSVGEFQRNVGNYPKQLKAMQKELQGLEVGSEQFNKLAAEAGALKDKIGDAKDATAAFAKDSKTATAGILFGQIGSDLGDLDFAGAADKAKQFGAVVKSISLAELVSGLKSLGVALLGVGKALLLNPLTLIAAAIAGIAYVTYDVIKSFTSFSDITETLNENIERTTKNIQELGKKQAEYLIKLAEAQGKITKEQADVKLKELQNSNERKQIAKDYADAVVKLATELELNLSDLQNGRFSEAYRGDYKETLRKKKFNRDVIELQKAFRKEESMLIKNQVAEREIDRANQAAKEKEDATKRAKEIADEAQKQREERDKELQEWVDRKREKNKELQRLIDEDNMTVAKTSTETIKTEMRSIDDLMEKMARMNEKRTSSFENAQIAGAAEFNTTQAELMKEFYESEIENFEDFLKKKREALKKDAEFQKQINKDLAETDKIVSNLDRALKERYKMKADALAAEQKLNEDAISLQQRLAERGLDNTLAFEKQKQAKLALEQEKQKEKEVREQKIIAFYNLFSSYAKTEPTTALQKAIVDTTLASIISGSFIEGTENVGKDLQGNKVHSGTDGYLIMADGRERIFNPMQNERIGDISNEEAANILEAYNKGILFNYGGGSVRNETVTQSAMDFRVLAKLDMIADAINSKPVPSIELSNLGDIIKTAVAKGVREITVHKNRI
jgi:hypothetical protein